MNPALRLPEIVASIFVSGLTARDLSNCRLVCRLWEIWASEILWRDVSLRAILQVVAPHTQTEPDQQSKSKNFQLGVIDEVAWQRFVFLSNRILHLSITCGINETSVGLYSQAKISYGRNPFSRLQSVDITTLAGQGRFFALSLVAGTSLRAVAIARFPKYTTEDCLYTSQELPRQAPNVAELCLGRTFGRETICPDLSQWTSLRQLSYKAAWITIENWRTISQCPNLTEVVLYDSNDVQDICSSDVVRTPRVELVYFPRLQSLRLTDWVAPRVGVKLLLHSHLPLLERIEWEVDSRPEDGIIDQLVPYLKDLSPLVDVFSLYVEHTFDGTKHKY